jgi:hypothetical protein
MTPTVFQCSQMSVRYEIGMHARQREKFAQQLGVPFRWLRYPCRFAREPCMYLLPRQSVQDVQIHADWSQPQESKHAGPRRTDRTGTVEFTDRASRED